MYYPPIILDNKNIIDIFISFYILLRFLINGIHASELYNLEITDWLNTKLTFYNQWHIYYAMKHIYVYQWYIYMQWNISIIYINNTYMKRKYDSLAKYQVQWHQLLHFHLLTYYAFSFFEPWNGILYFQNKRKTVAYLQLTERTYFSLCV